MDNPKYMCVGIPLHVLVAVVEDAVELDAIDSFDGGFKSESDKKLELGVRDAATTPGLL
jgi:hypothetical protein